MQVIASVFSDEMEILSNANVVEVGTNNATTTDASGRFVINVKDSNAQLKISHVGYDYDTFPVASGEIKNMGYVLLFPNTSLDEVTVIGTKAKKTDYSALFIIGGVIAIFVAAKALGGEKLKSKPARKVKV